MNKYDFVPLNMVWKYEIKNILNGQRISGYIKFHLFDGFPSKLLRDYDSTIYELNINNSLIKQKIY